MRSPGRDMTVVELGLLDALVHRVVDPVIG